MSNKTADSAIPASPFPEPSILPEFGVRVQFLLPQGAKVIVTGELELTAKSTGRRFGSDFVHVITLKDGKWTWFRDFMNTFVAAEGFNSS